MSKLFVDKNQLSKVELKLDTSGLYAICPRCNNSIAVANCEDFDKTINEHLGNRLVYEGIDEKGLIEVSYFFTCPCCEGKKLLPLEFRFLSEKSVLLFGAKVSKEAEKIENSTRIFKKQMQGEKDGK